VPFARSLASTRRRRFRCIACGWSCHADVAAALEIRRRAELQRMSGYRGRGPRSRRRTWRESMHNDDQNYGACAAIPIPLRGGPETRSRTRRSPAFPTEYKKRMRKRRGASGFPGAPFQVWNNDEIRSLRIGEELLLFLGRFLFRGLFLSSHVSSPPILVRFGATLAGRGSPPTSLVSGGVPSP
jgi:hypothetical protein